MDLVGNSSKLFNLIPALFVWMWDCILYACHVFPCTVMITKIMCEMSYRYDAQKDTLYAASALDPRFKAFQSLSAKERPDTFTRLQTEAATACMWCKCLKKPKLFNLIKVFSLRKYSVLD